MNNIEWMSEEGNDRWVAEIFNFKTNGFFVDAGATGGKNNSAYVLEKTLKWNGISINGNKYHCDIIKNKQNRMNVENVALWNHNGKVDFYLSKIGSLSKKHKAHNKTLQDLSYANSVVGYEHSKFTKELRKQSEIVQLNCLTLESVLNKHNAPKTIDYVGLDIEGSEYEVLRVFPFEKYKILTMSIEGSESFQSFLESKNFVRVVNPYCPKPWEHHYVNQDILSMYPYGVFNEK